MSDAIASKPIWDLPTRLFHWLLVTLVILQYGTAKFGWLDMQWHFWFGYALLALLLFRVAWGVCGSETSRFSSFIAAPARVMVYLRHWAGTPMGAVVGHNPAGGWATVLILTVLLAQALSGLLTSDDMEWFGPLCNHVSHQWIAYGTWLHHRLEPLLLALIGLHVSAIALYWFIKRENLVVSMWHGQRRTIGAAPRMASNLLALSLFVVIAAAVAALIWWLE